MELRQIHASKIFLAALLSIFVLEGTILSFFMPIFQNPDEHVHYGTVQHWAEPEEKAWEVTTYAHFIDGQDIRTSNLPQETVETAVIARFDEIKFQKQNTQSFSGTSYGPGEDTALENEWNRYVDTTPSAVSETKSVYYLFASWIERSLSDESIFTRIFSVRMLSVLFGVSVVLIAYLLARKIGFSETSSLAFSGIAAFQPMFIVTAAQVNIDIALVFSFSLFLYAGTCILGNGLNWKNALLTIIAAVLGMVSKGPGLVLVAALYPLFAWGAYRRLGISWKKFLAYLTIATVVLAGVALLAVPKSYLAGITGWNAQSTFDSPLKSMGKYLDKTMSGGELRETHASYWGNFGWLDTQVDSSVLDIIRYVEIIGLFGSILYIAWPLLAKSRVAALLDRLRFARDSDIRWLPERKYIIFLLMMIFALQFAIRFYDWRVFDMTGQLLIGTPGRYFLPNMLGHIVVLFVGLGFLLGNAVRFDRLMKTGLVAMVLLEIYSILWVIIPRYYL